jgi:HEAT repeat protein
LPAVTTGIDGRTGWDKLRAARYRGLASRRDLEGTMGLLDSMFGGGTSLTLSLDTPQASAGGVVGGKVTLIGGKKPLKLTELNVKLLYVSVTASEDSALPNIETEILLSQTVAAGEELRPGSTQTYTFRLVVPHDAETTAHNVTYKVMAVADIPSVKDPSASADLVVVDASDDETRTLPIEEIFGRFPDLRSPNEERLCEALREVFLACYSEGGQFMELEPFLSDLMRRGTVNVRRSALEAWANLVDNRVTPQHLQTLYAVANIPGLDQETFDQVIIAGCKFAEEGALPLVQQLAQHPDSHVRKEIANNLRFNAAEKFNGKRELLIGLAQDPDSNVRAAAVGSFSCYRDDQQIMHGVAGQIDRDPSPEVQRQCISALSLAHHHGMGELTFHVYEKHLANPDASVRKEIADSVHWLPKAQLQRIYALVQRLMTDPDEDVRRGMAFQFNNLSEMPQLFPLIKHAVENDPSQSVRTEALGAMASMLPPEQVVAYYGQVMNRDKSEDTLWALLNGLRNHSSHPQAKKMLTQLTQVPYPGLADAAREALTSY